MSLHGKLLLLYIQLFIVLLVNIGKTIIFIMITVLESFWMNCAASQCQEQSHQMDDGIFVKGFFFFFNSKPAPWPCSSKPHFCVIANTSHSSPRLYSHLSVNFTLKIYGLTKTCFFIDAPTPYFTLSIHVKIFAKLYHVLL